MFSLAGDFMKLRKYFVLSLFVLALSGCGHNVESLKILPALRVTDNSNKTNEIVIAAKVLNSDDCVNHFGVDLISNGYVPIQMKIINLTSNEYILSPSYINLHLVSSGIISKLMHHNTSRFAWICSIPAFLLFWPAMLLVGGKSYDMYSANKNMDSIIKRTSIDVDSKIVQIGAYNTIDKFLFIETKSYTPAFEIKLYNNTCKNFVTFCINLERN